MVGIALEISGSVFNHKKERDMNTKTELENTVLKIDELPETGVELSAEELSAVSGARPPRGSWASGSPRATDEWIL